MVKELFYKSLKPKTFVAPRGRRPVFLPNFTITLLRTPGLPPTMAKFLVPLNINKLDIKDYLYHAYNLPVLAVRSYIIQSKVRHGRAGDKWFKARQWFRPRSIKHMIVEMEDPFVWPREDRDLEGWDKTAFDKGVEAQKVHNEQSGLEGLTERKDQQTIREQAQALLDGKATWKPSWETYRPSLRYGKPNPWL